MIWFLIKITKLCLVKGKSSKSFDLESEDFELSKPVNQYFLILDKKMVLLQQLDWIQNSMK